MEEKINFRLDKKLHNYIEKYQIENNLEDLSDALREIIENQKSFDEGNIFSKLGKVFSK